MSLSLPLLVSVRLIAISVLLMLFLIGGCTMTLESLPPRTAHEQIMLSHAVRDSVRDWDLPDLADQRVYIDTTYFESIDRGFVVGEVRDWVGRQGALLVETNEAAQVRLELRSAGLGMERRERLVGIPSFALPIPGAAPLQTPELAIYKETRQKGVASLAVTAFSTETGRRLFGEGPRIGQTYQADAFLLIIPVDRTRYNVPAELQLYPPVEREE